MQIQEEGGGTLESLELGEVATVRALCVPEENRRRMLELGFVPGNAVAAELLSPWGDPVAYRIGGAVIALRRRDARHILINRT